MRPYPILKNVTQYGMPVLIKCKFCGGMYPQRQLLRENGEMYGYDDIPIVHNHWSICPSRGPLHTWCPGSAGFLPPST